MVPREPWSSPRNRIVLAKSRQKESSKAEMKRSGKGNYSGFLSLPLRRVAEAFPAYRQEASAKMLAASLPLYGGG